MAKGRLVGLPRSRSAQVYQYQLDRPPDGGVGSPALSKTIVAGVDVQRLGQRTIDDEQGAMNPCRTLDAAKVESIVDEGLHGSNHHGHMLWQAPGHDCIHCYTLDSGLSSQRRQFGNQLVTRPPGVGDELLHLVPGRRHYRQPIGPTGLVH